MNTSSRRIIGVAAAACLFVASSQIVGTAPDIIEGETLHTGMKITPAAAPGAVFQALSLNLGAGVVIAPKIRLDLALMNALDRNYRVHGSGVDAPGISVLARLNVRL